MRAPHLTSLLLSAALAVAGGCAPRGRLFAPVTNIPAGHGLVYIYSLPGSSNGTNIITHNSNEMGSLRPNQYLINFPSLGRNVYDFSVDRINVLALLVNYGQPSPTVLEVKLGKTYYLQIVGAGRRAAFWRVDPATALQELSACHLVETE